MPIIKRNGKWEIRIQRGGKRIRRSVTKGTGIKNPTRADAQRYHDQVASELEISPKEPNPLWSAALAEWIRNEMAELKHPEKYRNNVNALRPFIEGMRFSDTADVVKAIKRDRRERGLAASTVNRRLAILRRVGRLASGDWEWTDKTPRIALIREDNAREVYLGADEVVALARACDYAVAGDAILLSAYTGLRRSEMFRLRAEDFRDDELLVSASKNGRPRRVPVNATIRPICANLPLLITDSVLRSNWEQARERTGLDHVHWHDLRHTFASWLIQAGTDLLIVSKLLGHANVTVTQRYAHLANNQLADAVDLLPSLGPTLIEPDEVAKQ